MAFSLLSKLARNFGTKPKLMPIKYNELGEYTVITCQSLGSLVPLSIFGLGGYLYYIYTRDPDSLLGEYKHYAIALFGIAGFMFARRASKILKRIVLLEGGKHIRIEKHPLFGYGHIPKYTIPIESVNGLQPYGKEKWYNPRRWGKGYYRLGFYRKIIFGYKYPDYTIFYLPPEYDRKVLKMVAIGKPVNAATLLQATKGYF